MTLILSLLLSLFAVSNASLAVSQTTPSIPLLSIATDNPYDDYVEYVSEKLNRCDYGQYLSKTNAVETNAMYSKLIFQNGLIHSSKGSKPSLEKDAYAGIKVEVWDGDLEQLKLYVDKWKEGLKNITLSFEYRNLYSLKDSPIMKEILERVDSIQVSIPFGFELNQEDPRRAFEAKIKGINELTDKINWVALNNRDAVYLNYLEPLLFPKKLHIAIKQYVSGDPSLSFPICKD
ncbi:hypothetical protein DSO57_1024624 [Entomophthora muscae]|uniref:Uncharacterized protein n=1 Tax=Entomophthora muscae TaxID=34485 RepID=A0ACC2T2F1_9FUNG|nr:hypothetical protein DSO57_1024624 [Entomophthora muscae]